MHSPDRENGTFDGKPPPKNVLNSTLSRRQMLGLTALSVASGAIGFTIGMNLPRYSSDPVDRSIERPAILHSQFERHRRNRDALYSRFIKEELRGKYKLQITPLSPTDLKIIQDSQSPPSEKAPQIPTLAKFGDDNKFLMAYFLDQYNSLDGNLAKTSISLSPPINTEDPVNSSLDEVRELVQSRIISGLVNPRGVLTADNALEFASRLVRLPANIHLNRRSSPQQSGIPAEDQFEGKGVTDDGLDVAISIAESGVSLTVLNPNFMPV